MQFIGQTIAPTRGHFRRGMRAQLGISCRKHTRQWRGLVLFGGGVHDREIVTLGKDFTKQVVFHA